MSITLILKNETFKITSLEEEDKDVILKKTLDFLNSDHFKNFSSVLINNIPFHKQFKGKTTSSYILQKDKNDVYKKYLSNTNLLCLNLKNLFFDKKTLILKIIVEQNTLKCDFYFLDKNNIEVNINSLLLKICDNKFRRVEIFIKRLIEGLF